jgi:hypothetical protein
MELRKEAASVLQALAGPVGWLLTGWTLKKKPYDVMIINDTYSTGQKLSNLSILGLVIHDIITQRRNISIPPMMLGFHGIPVLGCMPQKKHVV